MLTGFLCLLLRDFGSLTGILTLQRKDRVDKLIQDPALKEISISTNPLWKKSVLASNKTRPFSLL